MYIYKNEDLFQQGERIVMTESVYVPNSLIDHEHEYLEIAYILEGSGYHRLNGRMHPVKKGDVFFIAKNSTHNFLDATPDFRCINFIFLPLALSSLVFTCKNVCDILKLTVFADIAEFQKISTDNLELYANKDQFRTLFVSMLKEYNEKRTGYQSVLKAYLSILCLQMFRIYAEDLNQGRNTDYTQLVLNYLESNSYDSNIKLEEIAKKAFISPNYFQKQFKKYTGKSLTQFLHEIRIEKACELIRNSDLPIVEVMTQVGYSDTKFFYDIFRRYTGMTPGRYKRMQRELPDGPLKD